MARITFRTKMVQVYTPDNVFAFTKINVPEFKRHHCDMNGFRTHKTYGSYANSDLFPSMLKKIHREIAPLGFWKLESIPEGVKLETNGFFATVTVDV